MAKPKSSKAQDKIPGIPVELNVLPEILDESEQAKHSLLMKGWHSNYADFEVDGREGCVLFSGSKIILEFDRYTEAGSMNPKGKRYTIDISPIIQALMEKK